ncbi:hypothetical protein CVD28_13530 [Bacillus sp. M6-12]|uniref:hypothetical protein n=1 Tax=Bacillus sp. M6-12 TaxID=2054166 RepID=UPI000C75A1F1|nr:hypothetical protein [Bacillus sp. M6-12]PLS17073.1 hypothetical protein CVD28_13530 [Bacillus sp. M6-12]
MSKNSEEKSLLDIYQSIWNNRIVMNEEMSEEEILFELVKRELLDENSHPRARKGRYEKFYMSIARIVDSSLAEQEKMELITYYSQMMEGLGA